MLVLHKELHAHCVSAAGLDWRCFSRARLQQQGAGRDESNADFAVVLRAWCCKYWAQPALLDRHEQRRFRLGSNADFGPWCYEVWQRWFLTI